MKKGILVCTIIGLVGLGAIISKSASTQKAPEGPVKVVNKTSYEVYVRVGYVDHSASKADILDKLKPYETWIGGKSGPINAVTGFIYTPSGRQNLGGFERKNYLTWSPLKDSHSFEIIEVMGYPGQYQVNAQ